MKNVTPILFFSMLAAISYSQNLVPNPSFEERNGCPQGYPDLDGVVKEWASFRGTPDYFHNCSSMNGYSNSWGYQEPHSGEAYTGIGTYQVTIINAKEHIGTQLISPLTIGEKYYISFYVSTAYTPLQMNIATNKMGALFTTYSYYYPLDPGDPPISLPNAAHIYNNTIIEDTTNWVKISGSFIADSIYNYLVIGSFFDDANTDTIHLPYQVVPQIAYYYLDDVCVSPDSLYTHTWTGRTGIKDIGNKSENIFIYPNPTNDFVNVINSELLESVYIHNTSGQMVYAKQDIHDRRTNIDISSFPKGVYIVSIRNKEGVRRKKLIIN